MASLQQGLQTAAAHKKIIGPVFGVVFFLCLVGLRSSKDDMYVHRPADAEVLVLRPSPLPDDFSTWDNCSVSFHHDETTMIQEAEYTKPFWAPYYPTSTGLTHRDLFQPIISELAGKLTAKIFYNKRCKGTRTENMLTATCHNIHPLGSINPPPETYVDGFQPIAFLAMRNPSRALPAHHQDKAMLYHGATEQVAEEEWMIHRDSWFETMWEEWESILISWKAMPYKLVYVQYEKLLDFEDGPKLVQEINDILRQANFTVPPDEDIPCVWYRRVGKEALVQHYENQYEFSEFTPSYNTTQQAYMMNRLEALSNQYKDDEDLVAILREYRYYIRDKLRLDAKL